MSRARIGVFDSGVGGLTVAARLLEDLPGVSYVYYGDTAHVPYGGRRPEEIVALVTPIAEHLLDCGAEALVMACNTSSALALEEVRSWCPVPVVGIIEPAARAAQEVTRSGRVGLIANPLTARSGAYERALAGSSVRLYAVGCPRLVPLVEAGDVSGPAARQALLEYLEPLQEAGIDTLILGCTHYPFLTPLIREILGPGVAIVDPAGYVVDELGRLGFAPGPGPAEHRYHVSGSPAEFERVGSRLLGRLLTGVVRVPLDGTSRAALAL
jgi:glutamate racemase